MEVDNERDTEVIDELKDKIEKEHNMHPNYSEEQKPCSSSFIVKKFQQAKGKRKK
jgi:hypothetical protein